MVTMGKPKRALAVGLQLVLLAIAAICIFYGGNSFAIHSAGILGIFAALAIALRSRSSLRAPVTGGTQGALALKPWHWLVGLALIIAVVAAVIWLHNDAMTGGKSGAPAYAFAATSLLSAGWWGGLFARWLRQ